MNEVEFVQNQIKNNRYQILPDTIAVGPVYKIGLRGSLETDGYEVGYLFLPKGSGIKLHEHKKDIERYKLIMGILSVSGKPTDFNICTQNNYHNIDVVTEDTIIQTCKVNQLYLDMLGPISNESFDKIVYSQEKENTVKTI